MRKKAPKEAIEILLASLASSTIKQYESALGRWWLFCEESEEEFFKPSVTTLLAFLTERFKGGASYSALNTDRCAVSLISKKKIGENEIISRFMKGVFNLRPARPKYSYTWDVAIVLRYLEKLYPLENLSLWQLTAKTVTLLAICTAHRAQTLASIKIRNIYERPNGIEIRVEDKIKTSGPGRYQPLLVLPKFNDKPSLCVASTLLRYLDTTRRLRDTTQTLFIAIKKPFVSVGAQTISRWIKRVLQESGIDVSIFTAHSVRHATTSSAFRKGIDLNTIRRTAGWSETSQVFARFYNKPITAETDSFANTILGH